VHSNNPFLPLTCTSYSVISQLMQRIRTANGSASPYLIVDGTQTVGVQPIDVQALQPDMLAASVHKWMLSPYGCSLIYLHPKHHDAWTPLDKNDRSRVGNDENEWVENGYMSLGTGTGDSRPVGYPIEFNFGAARIGSGGRPNPILLPMIQSALSALVSEFDLTELEAYLRGLGDCLEECVYRGESCVAGEFTSIGLKMIPAIRRSCNIISVYLHPALNVSPGSMVQKLKQQGIIVAARQRFIRISPHVFSTRAHMQQLYQAMRDIITTTGTRASSVATLLEVPYIRKKKILLIGGSGWLGQYLCRSLLHPAAQYSAFSDDSCEIHVTYNSTSPKFLPYDQCHKLDLAANDLSAVDMASYYKQGDRSVSHTVCWSVNALIQWLLPDVIVHMAAQSSPVKCESDPAAALALNCPTALVTAIKTHCPLSLLIYTSTDLVYDGQSPPYAPTSPRRLPSSPSTTYGRTKLAFEQEVVSLPKGIVLRLSNMVGGGYVFSAPSGGGGMKFLQWVQTSFLRKERVSLKNDEVRSFVSVMDVVQLIHQISDMYLTGCLSSDHPCWTQRVYNVGGGVPMSRLDFAQCVARANGSEICLHGEEKVASSVMHPWEVISVSSDEMNKSPPFPPRNVSMDISLTTKHFGIEFVDLNDCKCMQKLLDLL
jgi:dTDP-4-dehydrorhamnose reductase